MRLFVVCMTISPHVWVKIGEQWNWLMTFAVGSFPRTCRHTYTLVEIERTEINSCVLTNGFRLFQVSYCLYLKSEESKTILCNFCNYSYFPGDMEKFNRQQHRCDNLKPRSGKNNYTWRRTCFCRSISIVNHYSEQKTAIKEKRIHISHTILLLHKSHNLKDTWINGTYTCYGSKLTWWKPTGSNWHQVAPT